jgi:hypothetical protein
MCDRRISPFLTFTDMSTDLCDSTSQKATGMCPPVTAQIASTGFRQIVSAMIGRLEGA